METYRIKRGPYIESGFVEFVVLGKFNLDTGVTMVAYSEEIITVGKLPKTYHILPEKIFKHITKQL